MGVTKQSAYERLRSRRAAEAIRDGKISVPSRCQRCTSTSLQRGTERDVLVCVACGHETTPAETRKGRQAEIRRIIREGVDPRAS
jgi:uncharacterized protein (DUF983 family)